jgi:hypothetical protein
MVLGLPIWNIGGIQPIAFNYLIKRVKDMMIHT